MTFILDNMSKSMGFDCFYYLHCSFSYLIFESLKNIQSLSFFFLQIKYKKMFSRCLTLQEHPISYPSYLSFAVMFSVHYQLIPTLREHLLAIFQIFKILQNSALNLLVVQFFVFFKRNEAYQILSDFKIERKKLFDSDTRRSTRIFFIIYVLFLRLLGFMEVEVVIDGQNFSNSCFIQHLVDSFGYHAKQFFLVAVSEPEDKSVIESHFVSQMLVAITDLAFACDDALKKEIDFLLVVFMHFFCNQTVVFLQQIVFLLLTQSPHFLKCYQMFLNQFFFCIFYLLVAVIIFLFLLFTTAHPFSYCQIIKQSLGIIVSSSNYNWSLSSGFNLLQCCKGLTKVLIPIVSTLMQFECINHMMGYSFCLLPCYFRRHYGCMSVKLF